MLRDSVSQRLTSEGFEIPDSNEWECLALLEHYVYLVHVLLFTQILLFLE